MILLKNIDIEGKSCDMLISDGVIKKITPAGSLHDMTGECEVMDCTGKVAVPGFVNMHTHSAMSIMRGVGEDVPFGEWITKIWKLEENLDSDFVYWGAKVACLEMIKTGTTTFNDQYFFAPDTYRAAADMGIRPSLGYDILDRNDPAEAARQKEQCIRMYEDAMSNWKSDAVYSLAFHAIYTVSEPMILWISEFARERGIKLHIHLSETRGEVDDCKAAHGGLTPVEYLDSLGVLGPDVLAAHTLWLTEHDVELLGKNRVNCIHNINSNTKLASGYRFLYNELRDAGANVCIGTDGCASSNNVDMLEAMKTTALFQKAWRDDPKAMPIGELMDCATVNGARALGLNTGRIKEGAIADINIVDTTGSAFLSPAPFLANYIYSAHSDCIDSVIANGRFVMKHRIVEGEEEILSEARKVLSKLS